MFRLAAAILLLTATAAAAETIGDDFCTEMQNNYLACGEETIQTTAGGLPKMECPDTILKMAKAYDSVKLKAKPAQRPEIDRANELWKNAAYRIGRHLGEGEDQFSTRRQKQINDIVAECETLQAMDSN